jgi:hypothetical protein
VGGQVRTALVQPNDGVFLPLCARELNSMRVPTQTMMLGAVVLGLSSVICSLHEGVDEKRQLVQ